jgi:hypothetical protein
MFNKKQLKAILILPSIIFLTSCAGVQPWDREVLSRPELQLASDPEINSLDDHIYFSKEATSGGRSFAGGGCGCN